MAPPPPAPPPVIIPEPPPVAEVRSEQVSVSPDETPLTCPSCQQANSKNARFCRGCGAALSAPAGIPKQPVYVPPETPAPEAMPVIPAENGGGLKIRFGTAGDLDDEMISVMTPSRAGLRIGIAVVVLAIVVAAGAAAWYFLGAAPAVDQADSPPPEPAAQSAASVPQEDSASLPAAPPVGESAETLPVRPEPSVEPPAPVSEKAVAEPSPPAPAPAVSPAKSQPRRQLAPKREAAPVPPTMPPPVAEPQVPAVPPWLEKLRADLARCDAKGGLSGVWCTEKVRNKQCPGHWNTVKECEVAESPPPNQGF